MEVSSPVSKAKPYGWPAASLDIEASGTPRQQSGEK